jgi:hypothetical protein
LARHGRRRLGITSGRYRSILRLAARRFAGSGVLRAGRSPQAVEWHAVFLCFFFVALNRYR